MKTLNETVLELYKNFKSYSDLHTPVQVAEHIYPDWTILKLSDFSLVVTAVIETSEGYFEFRVQVTRSECAANVFVKYNKINN
jgi:hypothetical protein